MARHRQLQRLARSSRRRLRHQHSRAEYPLVDRRYEAATEEGLGGLMPTVDGFCHVYLPARNLDKAIEFYTRNLGFSLFRRWSAGPGRDAAYCILGGVLLEMSVPQGEAADT